MGGNVEIKYIPELTVSLDHRFPTEGHATYYATWLAREIEKQFGPNVRVRVEIKEKEITK